MNTHIDRRPWKDSKAPKKILIIRYQATGDLVVTLPYLNSLKRKYPDCSLHLLTRKEVRSIPLSLPLFDKVIVIGGGRDTWHQFFLTMLKIPQLLSESYDIVIDLQNHWISQTVRRTLMPKAWCAFDRYSQLPAGERTRLTIQSLNLGDVGIETSIDQRMDEMALDDKLRSAGWDDTSKLIVLNPAGAFVTRQWPIGNYVEFAQHYKTVDKEVQFLVTGLRTKIGEQVVYLKDHLGKDIIDMSDATNASEAFAIVRRAHMVVTEDSGLMHMAWVQGVPTLALFGSSNTDWSRPMGANSVCLDSSDLPCGKCLSETCQFGDVRCLTRYSPEYILTKALELIKTGPSSS